jgi:hypothetical protein
VSREKDEYAYEEEGDAGAQIPTSELGMQFVKQGQPRIPNPKFDRLHPPGSGFHQSARSARLKVGRTAEIPIVGINTPQGEVQRSRLEEVIADPEGSTYNSRLQRQELPHVFESQQGEHMVIDGNHRVAGALSRGQMIAPVTLITPRDLPRLRAESARVNQHKKDAEQNPRRNPLAEERYNNLWAHGRADDDLGVEWERA